MKRRKRQARHAGRRDAFHLTMIAVLMTVLCLMIVNIKEPEQTEEEQPETTHAEVVQNPETIVQTAEEAIKVIEEYLNLSDAVHMERNLNMSIPNNSILKDGKIKN